MSSDSFPVVDLRLACETLSQLHERVLRSRGRIEIVRADTGEACVLLSKSEISALEESLEMLASGDAMNELRGHVARIAQHAGPDAGQLAQA